MKKFIYRAAFVCAAFLILSPAAAQASAAKAPPKPIKYADAVKMATKKLSGVVSLEDSKSLLSEQKKYASSTEAWHIDKQIDSLKLNQDMVKISTEVSLRNILVNIENYGLDIGLLEETIVQNEANVVRVGLRRQYGMASDNDLRAAEQALAQNQANLDALLISLENEKINLNKILQLPLTQASVVDYERAAENPPEDLEKYIKDKLKKDPSVKQKQNTLDMKKREYDDYIEQQRLIRLQIYYGLLKPEEAPPVDPMREISLKSEYDKAKRELDDAKKAMETAIRANCNNLEQIRQRQVSLLVDLEKANDSYETATAHLQAGFATQYDVDNALLAISNTNVSIQKNLNSYWTLRFLFNHPFLLS